MKILMKKSATKSQHLKALTTSSSATMWTLNITQWTRLPLLMSRPCKKINSSETSSAFLHPSLPHLASKQLTSNYNLVILTAIRLRLLQASRDVTQQAAVIAKTRIQLGSILLKYSKVMKTLLKWRRNAALIVLVATLSQELNWSRASAAC